MADLAEIIIYDVISFIAVLVIFGILLTIGKYLFKTFKNTERFKSSRFFNPQEYLPEEELSTIRQVFFLVIVLILVMDVIYHFFTFGRITFNLLLFDIIISLYLAITLEVSSFKDRCILFLLVPFGSISYIWSPDISFFYLDYLHIIGLLYFIRYYFRKFFEYTEENGLGITIMLLFAIIFISFIFTIIVEGVTPLDSMEMVSNAFTSNGYAILGTSSIGKLNAIFLVWSGFILSGVGTATLTVAIVMRHVNEKFDHLEDLARKNRKK